MKYIVLSLLLLVACLSNAQNLQVNTKNQPAYYIDSVLVPKMPYLDINKITDMTVVKESGHANQPNGAVYIRTKNPTDLHLLSLEAVAQKYIPAGTPYLVMVDNEFIRDMTGVKIDSAYILRCDTLSTKEFSHLQNAPALMILKIYTRSKANAEKEGQIMIRG